MERYFSENVGQKCFSLSLTTEFCEQLYNESIKSISFSKQAYVINFQLLEDMQQLQLLKKYVVSVIFSGYS
jgi:hypothetical protein